MDKTLRQLRQPELILEQQVLVVCPALNPRMLVSTQRIVSVLEHLSKERPPGEVVDAVFPVLQVGELGGAEDDGTLVVYDIGPRVPGRPHGELIRTRCWCVNDVHVLSSIVSVCD